MTCRCPRCAQLGRFLRDPEQETWSFRAVEADRAHVAASIRAAGRDLVTRTEKRGSPHGLVCTNTQASHERRVAQRRQDRADLALLGD